jgi:hypothetical protein
MTAVYIDDDFMADVKNLKFLGQEFVDWPLPYKIQAALYNRLLKYHPKAVFIDLAYFNQRQSDAELAYLSEGFIHNAQRAGKNGGAVPIYLAALQVTEQDNKTQANIRKIQRPLAAFEGKATPVLAGWDAVPDRYPLAVDVDGVPYPSAAFALYQTLCAPDCPITLPKTDNPSQALAIQWANRNTRYLVQTADPNQVAGCRFEKKNPLSIVSALFLKKWKAFFDVKDDEQTLCPPVDTIHASVLIDPDVFHYKQALQDMIEDRVILIGASVSGAEDLLPTTTHGLQPGVYTHAMALDNLLSYGDQYPRHTVFQTYLEDWMPFVLELVLLFLAITYRQSAMWLYNDKFSLNSNHSLAAASNQKRGKKGPKKPKPLSKESYEEGVIQIERKTFCVTVALAGAAILILKAMYPDMSGLGIVIMLLAYLPVAISLTPKWSKKVVVESINSLSLLRKSPQFHPVDNKNKNS